MAAMHNCSEVCIYVAVVLINIGGVCVAMVVVIVASLFFFVARCRCLYRSCMVFGQVFFINQRDYLFLTNLQQNSCHPTEKWLLSVDI